MQSDAHDDGERRFGYVACHGLVEQCGEGRDIVESWRVGVTWRYSFLREEDASNKEI